MDETARRYCVMVTALNVSGHTFHQGEVLEERELSEFAPLLLDCGYIAKTEEVAIALEPNPAAA